MAKKKTIGARNMDMLTSWGFDRQLIERAVDEGYANAIMETLEADLTDEEKIEHLQWLKIDTDESTDVVVNDYPDADEIDAAFNEEGLLSLEKCRDMFIDASEKDLARIVGVTNQLLEIQKRSEGLVQRTAYLLWIVDSTQAYKTIGYKNTASYAKEVLGINSKGSVSDAINTYARFGETGVIDWEAETSGRIKQEYGDFNFSTLMRMKKLSDSEIQAIGITPDMSRSQVVKAINEAIDSNTKRIKEAKEKEKLVDGSVEDEIEKELEQEKDEGSAVEPEHENVELSDNVFAELKLTYRRGDDFKWHVSEIAEQIAKAMQEALDSRQDVNVLTVYSQVLTNVE